MLPVAVLAALEIWARTVDLHSDSLAPPSAIAAAFGSAIGDGAFLSATRDTLASAFAGLFIGGAIGLSLGIALGVFQVFDRLMEVTIEAIRPIPSIALLPIALIALGFGYRMEIAIVAFACVWPILILSRAAVREVEPRLMEVAARAAAVACRSGAQDHHSGGAAAHLCRVSSGRRHRTDRRGHRRDRDQSDRPGRGDHGGPAGRCSRI